MASIPLHQHRNAFLLAATSLYGLAQDFPVVRAVDSLSHSGVVDTLLHHIICLARVHLQCLDKPPEEVIVGIDGVVECQLHGAYVALCIAYGVFPLGIDVYGIEQAHKLAGNLVHQVVALLISQPWQSRCHPRELVDNIHRTVVVDGGRKVP